MKKLFSIFLAVSLAVVGYSLPTVSYADVQIDEGQKKSQGAIKFFIGRYGRTGAIATAGGFEISADSVVIWDGNSQDGVSVLTSTTSNDPLVAGITMDLIPGSSADNSAAVDESNPNWGRIQTWGLFSDARVNSAGDILLGVKVCQGGTAQALTQCTTTSADYIGIALEAEASSTVDIMVYGD